MPLEPRPLLASLEAAAADAGRGIVLLGSDGRGKPFGYDELLARSRAAAVGLLEAGLSPGDRAFLVLPTGEEVLVALFGCLLAGVVPSPLSPPQGGQSAAAFRDRLAHLARHLRARAVLARPEVADGLDAGPGDGVLALTPEVLDRERGTPPVHRAAPEDPAFIQLTSGSTALPKGVVISHRAVAANLAQIAPASGIVAGDVMVSWLPLFHDMGLVGALLLSIASRMDLVLSSPFSFLRRPALWVQAIHRYRGTHTLAPTFAYRQLVERLSDRDLDGLDLASWRVAYVGAEPVHADTLEEIEARLAPHGLSSTTLLPCYGMAEATLAITFKPHRERWRERRVSRAALAASGAAVPPAGTDDDAVVVSCGRPLEGTEVEILDPTGHPLPEDRLGEIVIRGPSLFSGYFGLDDPSPRELARGFRTGDLGFLEGGELFIVGRRKEVIILGGENHHPAEVEWAAGEVPGVRRGRVAAFGVFDHALGTDTLCLLAELARRSEPAGDADGLVAEVRQRVREATGLVVSQVRLAPAGTLPVTTSGKLQRARAREIFLDPAPLG
jgi:acyl-CoA synthetase (AMP-forming)/AMP-acid ligase II